MIDQAKLDGLLDAIATESKSPSPSHQNLARLVVMTFQEIRTAFTEEFPPIEVPTNGQVEVVTEPRPAKRKKEK